MRQCSPLRFQAAKPQQESEADLALASAGLCSIAPNAMWFSTGDASARSS
jgi:hypothetical protein